MGYEWDPIWFIGIKWDILNNPIKTLSIPLSTFNPIESNVVYWYSMGFNVDLKAIQWMILEWYALYCYQT